LNIVCYRYPKSYGEPLTMFGYGVDREELDWTIDERVDFTSSSTTLWSFGNDRDTVPFKLPLWIASEL
jgi:hypothetical protein